jgi:hypothetical protein
MVLAAVLLLHLLLLVLTAGLRMVLAAVLLLLLLVLTADLRMVLAAVCAAAGPRQ